MATRVAEKRGESGILRMVTMGEFVIGIFDGKAAKKLANESPREVWDADGKCGKAVRKLDG